MKKKFLVAAVAAAMVLSFASCGEKASGAAETQTAESTAASTAESTAAGTEVAGEPAAGTEATEESASDTAEAAETTQEAETEEAAAGSVAFDLPEGFSKNEEASSDILVLYTSSDATKGSNINVTITPNDGSFATVTPEMMIEASEQQFESAYSMEVDIELVESQEYEIDGHAALSYTIQYELGEGQAVKQLQVIVEDAEQYTFVTYTEINEEGYFDAFKASADTIRFE